MKGVQTMLVKAKWNVKDSTGWHRTGEVFQTESDLGDAVEVICGDEKKTEPVQAETVKEEKPVKTSGRRKKISE